MAQVQSDVDRRLPAVLPGVDTIRLIDGRERPIVQLNNAATTPPLVATMKTVETFLGSYGALHRGQGPRARATCAAVENAVVAIRSFLKAGPDTALLFAENSSAAINLFARLMRFEPGDAVLISEIEHTSNYLPWRMAPGVTLIEAGATIDGALDYDDLARKACGAAGRLRLIAVTGASNQSGFVPDLGRLSALASETGAILFVDAAQLAPHRPIDMVGSGINALALSAHKLYAPFGLGVLAVPAALLASEPVNPGGGSVDMIGAESVIWSHPSVRHQTGTWNATGIVALGASCAVLEQTGWPAIIGHERAMVSRLVERLSAVPGLRLMVPAALYDRGDRVGVVPFLLDGYHHAEIAAILEHEYGVEVRAGTICNHRLVRRWMGVGDAAQAEMESRIAAGDRLASYGVVRASIGVGTDAAAIDALADALEEIARHGPRLTYQPEPEEETYRPVQGS